MQKIFFGPPGCGKSYYVRGVAIGGLKIAASLEALNNNPNMIEATFHPEYGYGDFVAKLLPKTKPEGGIEYLTHAGPLIKALARAYAEPDQPVLLVIDEINRGNCAQIFGDIFQLLDRNDAGWSEYGVNPSDLVMDALKQELGKHGKQQENLSLDLKGDDSNKKVTAYKLHLPPNLSLIGTMNTSDESVYYMDTAFKRRWDFEFMSWQGGSVPEWQRDAKINIGVIEHTWHDFLESLNDFIAHEFKGRNVDDKQVGIWFLKAQNPTLEILHRLKNEGRYSVWRKYFPIVKKFAKSNDNLKTDSVKSSFESLGYTWPQSVPTEPEKLAEALIPLIKEYQVDLLAIQHKLMFFLWDNVFSRSREPLYVLLEKGGAGEKEPRTFGAFSAECQAFITGVMKWDHSGHKWQ